MAKKSGKSRKSPSTAKQDDPIIDAEVVDEAIDQDLTTPEDLERALSEGVTDLDDTDADAQPDEAETAEDVTDPEPPVEDTAPAEETVESGTNHDDSATIEPDDTPSMPEPEPAPALAPAPAPAERPSVFVPMVLGGLVAGLFGYGIAYMQYANQGELATAAQLEALSDEMAELPPPTDISGLTEQVGILDAGITDLGARIDSGMAELEERIVVLERQPNADGTLTDTAMAAFEADMQNLRTQLEGMTTQTAEQLAATQASAQEVQANAVEAARRATARAALARVQGALETGAPFAALLPELESALEGPTPEAISAVSDGVPTLNALQTSFPDAARAALATARSEGVDGGEGGGLGAFLRTQLNARSIQPQEGDGVDAVLSRVEGAMAQGRLNDALAEAAALPDVAKAAISDWLAQAEARAAALDAAESLSTSLSD